MTELPDNFSALIKPDLFEAFKNQIKKDFENCGLNSDFVSKILPDYALILQIVALEVNSIIKQSSTKLNELLYRIDISELQIKKLSKQKADSDFIDIVAELIIKRELQKVVIREMFKE